MVAKHDPETKIINAALLLAADRPWREITLRQIAAEAKVTLGALSREFGSKSDILAQFMADIDRQMLDGFDVEDAGESARDRLFDCVMNRLDILRPHRPALRNIVAGVERDPMAIALLAPAALRSQEWILTGANVRADGALAAAKRAGLALVYRRAFLTWLDDDDPGLARTMATLDRALRRGESWLNRMEMPLSLGSAVFDFARGWRGARRDRRRREAAGTDEAAQPPAPS